MKKIFIILAIIGILTGVNCRSKKTPDLIPTEKGSDKTIYEKAKKLRKRDGERARLLFKQVIQLYPDSVYSRLAKIGIADSYFKQKDSASLIMAAAEYQEFANQYPNSPDAIYAKFQIGVCYDKQSKGPGRDQTYTKKAIKAYQSMIKQYPDSEEAEKAKERIKVLRKRLSKHYFSIAMSNYRFNAFKGAIDRFKQVMDEYPEFTEKDKMFYYTAKSYLAIRKYDSALSFFRKIINSYPKSKYIKKTKSYLQKLEHLIKEEKKIEKEKK